MLEEDVRLVLDGGVHQQAGRAMLTPVAVTECALHPAVAITMHESIVARLLTNATFSGRLRQMSTADLAFLGASVFTGKGSPPRVASVAISGGRIAAVGTEEDVREQVGTKEPSSSMPGESCSCPVLSMRMCTPCTQVRS